MSPRRSDFRAAAGASPSHSRLRTLAVRIGLAMAALAIAASTASAQKLQFRQLTPDQGLSSSLVQSIMQDSRGFVWLGTKKGINRYDGYTFAINVLLETQGTLYIGTARGLYKFDREAHRATPAAERLVGFDVEGLFED